MWSWSLNTYTTQAMTFSWINYYLNYSILTGKYSHLLQKLIVMGNPWQHARNYSRMVLLSRKSLTVKNVPLCSSLNLPHCRCHPAESLIPCLWHWRCFYYHNVLVCRYCDTCFQICLNSSYSSISLFQLSTISLRLWTYITSDHSLALRPEQGFCSVDYLSWSLWVFRSAVFYQHRPFVSPSGTPSKYPLHILHSLFPCITLVCISFIVWDWYQIDKPIHAVLFTA